MKPCVLIVDDQVEFLESIRRGLRCQGYEVLTETSPQCAINMIASGNLTSVGLVLTDYSMPEMNGLELLLALRHYRPTLPGLLMTAYGNEALKRLARQKGCNQILEKPFTMAQLQVGIELALG